MTTRPIFFPNIRRFLLIACLCLPSFATADPKDSRKPNIVFILCDDLGYGDLGAFFQNRGDGGRKPNVKMAATPRLDEIAAKGMQMRNHYTAAPVCAPARASLLLGVHQGHANVRNNQFDKALEDNHTLASVLKEAGYRSACIGKWGLQGEEKMPAHPLKRGFDEYFGYIGHGAGHKHYPKEDRQKLFDGLDEVSKDYDKCYTTDLFTARAKKFVMDHHKKQPEQPFFLYLAYDTPHAKTQAPSTEYPEGAGTKGGLQWLGTPGHMINTASGKPDSWLYPEHRDATWEDPKRKGVQPWPDTQKRYATMVRRIDDCVNDLVATLRDLGIEKNTLVVFTSDNGPSKESYLNGKDSNGYPREFDPSFFMGYGPFDGIKRDCYEGGVRVGAIAYWPETIPAGKISPQASQFHDWMPTFCEMAGIPAPARTDGVSLLPELAQRGERPPSTVYVEYSHKSPIPKSNDFLQERQGNTRSEMQMIRTGDLVGVRYDVGSHEDKFEIYDVAKDPAQRRNLADSKSDIQNRMKDRVLQIRRPDPTSKRPYMDSLPIPPVSLAVSTVAGLEMRTVPTEMPWPIHKDAVKGAAPVFVTTPKEIPASVGPAHGAVFQGWLQVPTEGSYQFSLPEGCRAVLKLHEATVLDTDRGSGESDVRLAAGRHPLTLSVLMKEKSPAPLLMWSVDGGQAEPIPAKNLTRAAK
ncbi:MAG: sulfatase-like hydrolase/transferase [Verrucomicrobiota bacterium]